ncbi:MAG: SDR family oxidoreductase [candidate division Zixibacteria bacterium]
MKRIIITGAAGLLGQHLIRCLKSDKNHDSDFSILSIDKAANPFKQSANLRYIQTDLIEFDPLKSAIEDFKPDLIFNCASYNDVDGAEENKKLADDINVHLVENLLELSPKKIIHFSSDYVFNGLHGPYSEEDTPLPINHYGQTKYRSERILTESGGNHLIIRSNVLYGTGTDIRPNFVTWLIGSLRRNERVRIVTDQFGNPTYAGNLAEAAIEAARMDFTGILHIAGKDYLSRYEAALKAAAFFNLDSKMITPIITEKLSQPARRPLRAGLTIDKAGKLLKTGLLGLDEGLRLMADF